MSTPAERDARFAAEWGKALRLLAERPTFTRAERAALNHAEITQLRAWKRTNPTGFARFVAWVATADWRLLGLD
jgi:hypothetical protein